MLSNYSVHSGAGPNVIFWRDQAINRGLKSEWCQHIVRDDQGVEVVIREHPIFPPRDTCPELGPKGWQNRVIGGRERG